MNLENLFVSVLGAGRSGRAAAVLAAKRGARVTLYDASANATFDGLPEGVSGVAGVTIDAAREVASDLVVISPGVETQGEWAQAFCHQAGEFIGETELGYRFYQGRIVGITGTNGKTTTTEIVEAILNQAGISCMACGNYGKPICEVVSELEPPAAVSLELSSFQLETIVHFHPEVAVWLNLAPDHMDRYSGMGEYRAAKARIFENMSDADRVVIRAGESPGVELSGEVLEFSAHEASSDYRIEGSVIHGPTGEIVDLSRTRLRGLHNAENVMAAAAATEKLGAVAEHVSAALADYQPPRHRCEYVATVAGVEYINDSKATNLHALESALRSFREPIVLIAGGKQKNLDYAPLVPLLDGRVVAVVTFGEIAQPLAEVLSAGVATVAVETLTEAVSQAAAHAREGDIVLLSPGTSSFDQFSGYEARGDAFCDAVHALNFTPDVVLP